MQIDNISDDLLASYIDGTTTREENDLILEAFKQNQNLFDEFKTAYCGANMFDENSGNLTSHSKNISIIPDTVIGNEIYNSLNLFKYSEIHNQPSMVAASNNHHHDDRMHKHLNSIFETNHYNQNMETTNSNQIIGENPMDILNNDVQQQYNDTCAIKSQQLILNDFGIPVTEDMLVQQAEQIGVYSPGSGTLPQDIGKLLEMNGVHCTQHENASVFDLTSALSQGEKIIIGVDSSELWNKGLFSDVASKIDDLLGGEKADHALIVAGIDTTDPNNVQVILTDPGSGEEAARYPMDKFLDAWHDSGNFMVTTDAPAPLAHNPEMVNFDYSAGHLAAIGQMPYDYFDQMILPLSQETDIDSHSLGLLYDDFTSMIHGNSFSISPELIATIENIPDIDIPDIDINEPSSYPIDDAFGGIHDQSVHPADFYIHEDQIDINNI